MICAIILAAGKSERMGKPKQLLPFGDKTIIETILEKILQSDVEETIVVLGANREKIKKKIKNFPVNIILNPHFSEGMLSSVQAGYRAIPDIAKGVLVILGDQPDVSVKVINTLIREFKKTKKGIILPVHNNRRGHPVLINTKYREEVKNLSSNIGLRELIRNHPDDIFQVEVGTSSIFQDIDNMDDYKRELKNS